MTLKLPPLPTRKPSRPEATPITAPEPLAESPPPVAVEAPAPPKNKPPGFGVRKPPTIIRYHEVPHPASTYLKLPVLQPAVRSTAVSTLAECPRKYMFRYRFGLVSRGAYSKAMSRGTIYHVIMGARYQGCTRDRARELVGEHVSQTLAQLRKSLVKSTGLLPNGRDIATMETELRRDEGVGSAMGLWAWDHDAFDLTQFVPFKVEELLVVSNPRLRHPIQFKADLILANPGSDPLELWIVDHKTSSISPIARMRSFAYSFQLKLYRMALATWLKRNDDPTLRTARVVGAIHSVIQTPTIRQRTARQPETFEEYCARLHEWYDERAGEGSVDPPFVLGQTRFYEEPEDPEMLFQLRRAARHARIEPTLTEFYRVDRACIMYNKPCEYLSLCEANPITWSSIVPLRYELDPSLAAPAVDNIPEEE